MMLIICISDVHDIYIMMPSVFTYYGVTYITAGVQCTNVLGVRTGHRPASSSKIQMHMAHRKMTFTYHASVFTYHGISICITCIIVVCNMHVCASVLCVRMGHRPIASSTIHRHTTHTAQPQHDIDISFVCFYTS